ncbi:MAG TPA: hypothetical protein VLN48_09175 [Bryobacteraceae bacterium]|nr:hypothetical protein [Bryobacteraceae bacterium]
MEQLQRSVTELAIRLLASPADSLSNDPAALAEIERIATQLLKEVAAARAASAPLPGERRGAWRIPQPHA